MLEAPIRNAKLLTVMVLIVCVLGISAARMIPVQMIPDLDVRTISVVTQWPGATPQDIEKEILIEQERYLRNIPNLKRMESFAETGVSYVELDFPFGVDINETLIEVANALSQVPSYPENVDQPSIRSSSFSENAFMYFAVSPLPGNPLNLDIDMITDFIDDNIRTQMERVPGVSEVQLRGGAERQMQIFIDPAKLAQRGLSLTQVRDAIRARNSDTSAGDLDDGKKRYLIRTVGRFDNKQELEELILAHRNGTDIFLKDVATINLGHYEVREVAVVNDERGLTMAVKREPGSNVIDIKSGMMQVVEEMRRDLLHPNGLDLVLIGDDVRYVESSIQNVSQNLLLGALLATIILFLFLRSIRGTLIGLMGMPVCIIAAFLGLLVFDRTINVISLAGIAFAIGMTVDNTIVVLESIEQARRRGLDRIEAAITGVREVWTAVLASSMTTILVFAPVLFVQEEAGQLYSDIAIAISVAILASMLFAVTVVPAACAHFGLGKSRGTHEDLHRRGVILHSVNWITGGFFRRLITMLITVSATLVAAWHLMPPAEYLPEGEEPKAFTSMIPPPGYNLSEMLRISEEVIEILSEAKGADPALFDRGEAPLPSLAYYFIRTTPTGLRVLSEPTRTQDIELMMNALTDLFESYPGMRAFSGRGSIISSDQGGTRAVSLDIAGPDMENLYSTAEFALKRAEQLFENPQIDSIPGSLSLDQPLIEIRPRWSRLTEVGFTANDFGFSVAALSDGAFVDEFFIDDDKVDMFLFSTAGQQQNLSGLAGLPVLTPNGGIIPLNALADLVETVDSATLRRVDSRRTVTLLIIPPRDVALETAVNKVRNEMIPAMQAEGEVAKGINLSISGASDQLDATRESLSENLVVAVILIYLVLVAIFSHWGYPLIILTTVPLGIAGGIVGLVAINASGSLLNSFGLPAIIQPFDMITMLGFVILLGTVVNNPILIVEQARRNLTDKAISVHTAVNQAVATRLRPILMSTLTTIFGLAPLVFIPGAGTELYRGVGIVVLVGIAVSTLITLTFLPSLLISILSWTQRKQLSRQPQSSNA
ncbi:MULTISPECIES: efflux RND transporter permease subunit [unclassified Methylophaga]|jgi:multidrug efflux pump subunit AcrB|uniref:efflux RND transporter permease subunit n=1 Tax=unclassified Methylophaga TaxID=2629249 RepID=UPI000C9167E1|nr:MULTISPECIES: efflux RND transporter permease subunit [unclassified Methylophaga]MAK68115.1 acriflavin resistance protein [Methylophaga sp.]MAY17864.1 acriflavin resistance protein [Methylophaga sp.]MBN46930.1 acriflavin resistance protein [Methylophaga sp.]|tara:strand:+ start:28660 stop:31821 length:3162 start_codon:yes stop_codon:yes gene_type:complete